ncbi:T9SS type A sorting domain-containing protein [Hymenobacter convexus]|uniref:T9SS type A sorting domain-containing protein n=1 Tax=Hymenobacter sp. CA1UV-4 TaxID=3063782 RepID=UPI0027131813|nr:T9SS type A sorting domain-containing protein [Hymenobacter sp. CA1UV-4]MDO7850553.1 T9SS type A sorting domain-containing protein [Hymenobacter sp. CA1UV-4]
MRNLLLSGLLLGSGLAHAQAPAWQSAVPVASAANGAYTVTATAPDATGANVYLTGYFTGTVALGGSLLTSYGLADGFVGKWNVANRGFMWVQRMGGPNNDQALALAVNGTAVYVAGVMVNTVSFGGTAVSTAGAADGFVAKYVDAGTSAGVAWVQATGGANEDRATAVAVSGTNVYVAGTFRSPSMTLGGITLNNPTATGGTAGLAHCFVAKLADVGTSSTFGWARANGGNAGDDQVAALAVSGTNVYMAGDFVGNIPFGTTTLSSNGGRDAYVAKLVDGGNNTAFAWAKNAGSTGPDQATALAVSGSNVYVAGSFSGLAIFDAIGLVSAGTVNAFVARLTDAGLSSSFTWAQQAGGTASDQAAALAVSGSSVYVAGAFSSPTAAFGTLVLNNTTPAGRATEVFVARLTDAGTFGSYVWAQQAGGTGNDQAASVALSGATVFVGGSAMPPASFGSLLIPSGTANTVGFLASMAAAPLAVRAAELGDIALFPNPAHATATVQAPVGAVLTVLDALGRPVRTCSAAASPATMLDLAGLTPGVYAVHVRAGGGTATRRLVVE